jgi:hypothetical protein
MKKTAIHALLGLLSAAVLGGAAFAQEGLSSRIDQVREQYGVEQWQLGAMRDGLLLGSAQLPGLQGGEVRPKGDLIQRVFLPADAPQDAKPALVVEAKVADTVEGAQDQLVLWLAGLSSPQPALEARRYDVQLGQAAYVGPSGAGPRAFSWVAFVQGNVAVRLLNSDPIAYPTLDLPKLAAALDAGIAARAPLALGAALPKPEIAKLAVANPSVVAGRAASLALGVVDPLDGAAVLAWSVGGEGQGYVELRDDGWIFYPTGVGAVTVTLTAVGSTGTTATRTLDLVVAHD